MVGWHVENFPSQGRDHALWSRGEGTPLLLVHGSLSSHRFWHPLAARLPAGMRMLAPDLAGYGKSAPLPPHCSALHADQSLLVALLDAAGAPTDVVAHSYGGAVALMAAMQRPHRVRSLTLVEPTLFPLLRAAGDWQAYRRAAALTDGVAAAMRRDDADAALDAFLRHWLPPWSRWLIPARARKSLLRGVPRLLREVESIHHWHPPLDALSALPVPVQFIAGTRTRAPLDALAALLREQCPHWLHTRVSGAGHFLPLTHAPALARCLGDWLQAPAQTVERSTRSPLVLT